MPQTNLLRDDTAAARLAGLLDSAMDAIIAVDESQRIVMYNRAAERIFGRRAADVLGTSLDRLIPPRYRAGHAEHVRQFGHTGVSSRRMSGSSIVHGLRANGEEFPVDASISQLDTPEGKLYTVILRDVSERQRAVDELQRVAEQLTGLLDSAMDGIISIGEDQRIQRYNHAAERIFGWRAADVLGQPLAMLIPERFRPGHPGQVTQFGRTGVTSRRMGGSVVLGLRANGEEFPIEASISQLDASGGRIYTVILRDVTERVRAQEELATLAAAANHVREQEKSRIARELHDELAQSLTALKMDVIWVRERLRSDPEAAVGKLGEMLAMLDTSVAATRRISADLRPLVLDDLGLGAAIEWVGQTFSQRSGIACELDLDEELDLPEPYATAVFRIVQEALVNVAKHSRATGVQVHVARNDGELLMRVRDNGVGFSPAAPRKPQSLGIAGLRERAHLLKGEVRVDSAPGEGTTVEARIPLAEDAA